MELLVQLEERLGCPDDKLIRGPSAELDQACRSSSFADLWDIGMRYFVFKYQAEGDLARRHALLMLQN